MRQFSFMQQPIPTNLKQKLAIAQNFSKVAAAYDEAAVLQQEIGRRLLERLDLIKFSPSTILDLGSGTGFFSKALSQKYSRAIVLNADIAEGMVNFAKHNHPTLEQFFLCADGDYLPIKSQSVDFVFSNCALHWFFSPQSIFKEIHRILKPEGLLLFSTLGPDTLKELRMCFKILENKEAENPFIDMHDIGDMLLQEGLIDPVMDMENITLTYKNIKELLNDLKLTGSNHLHTLSYDPITPDCFNRLSTLYEKYKNVEQRLPATFEVIYGHAWRSEYAITEDCRRIPLTLET